MRAVVPLLIAGMTVAGCSGAINPPPHYVIPDAAAPSSSSTTDPPVAQAPVDRIVAPSQLTIDKIGVNAALKSMGLKKDHTLDVPDLDHISEADWLCDGYNHSESAPACRIGAVPGTVAPAVIAGHIDGKGKKGVFYRLRDMAKGDDIKIRRTDGSTLTFRVSSVECMSKYPGADKNCHLFDPKKVYGNVARPALRVISCGGPFVGGETGYADNIVVFAELA